jgi:hypothetical protein
VALPYGGGATCDAQTDLYRIIDLGDGAAFSILGMQGYGLNDVGDTVGTVATNDYGVPANAWRWVFSDSSGGARIATALDTTIENEATRSTTPASRWATSQARPERFAQWFGS